MATEQSASYRAEESERIDWYRKPKHPADFIPDEYHQFNMGCHREIKNKLEDDNLDIIKYVKKLETKIDILNLELHLLKYYTNDVNEIYQKKLIFYNKLIEIIGGENIEIQNKLEEAFIGMLKYVLKRPSKNNGNIIINKLDSVINQLTEENSKYNIDNIIGGL